MSGDFPRTVQDYFDFCKEEDLDVSDEIFLSNSRMNSISVAGSSMRGTNPFLDEQSDYLEKRREIESRTLESTQKSLGLLYETEEVGKATAVELTRQREQLENSSRQLDEINSKLRFSQRHLNGLKSIFGGLKNYLSASKESSSTRLTSSSIGNISREAVNLDNTMVTPKAKTIMSSSITSYDKHPISRIRYDLAQNKEHQQFQEGSRNNTFEAQLESNLEEMCNNLSRLKYLATDLGSEITSQNDLLENMTYKVEDVELKIGKQNKDMNKLLKK